MSAAIVPYLNALGGGFVSDALLLIPKNQALLESKEWLAWFSRDFYWGSSVQGSRLYRPLTILSFLFHIRTTGLSPFPFHLTNILLHAGVSLLVFRLGAALLGWPGAFLGALIFAVHPLHTEAVAWVMGRSELLAALFGLAACLAYLRATNPEEERPMPFAIGAVVAYAAALFSKEHVALLPLWFALVWLLRKPRPSARRTLCLLVSCVLVLGSFLLMRANVATRAPIMESMRPLFNPTAVVSAPLRWLTAAGVIARYGLLFVWPSRLSHDYSYAQIPVSTGVGVPEAAGIALICGVLIGIGVLTRRVPGAALVLALVPITFLLVSNLPFRIGTIMAERLTYLPSAGLALFVGWLLTLTPLPAALFQLVIPADRRTHLTDAAGQAWQERVVGRARSEWVTTCLIVGVIVALALRTGVRSNDWKDDYNLYASALRVSPKSAHVQTIMSDQERLRGNYERALVLAQEALRTYPRNYNARISLAEVRMLRGEFEDAIEALREAILLAPRDPSYRARLHHNLGVALHRLGRSAEAEREFVEAIRLMANDLPPRVALGMLLLEAGRPAEAFKQFREAMRLSPDHPVLLYGMARAALALGDRQTAETYARRASNAGLKVPDAFWQSLGLSSGGGLRPLPEGARQ